MNGDPRVELAGRLAAGLASDDGTLLLARLQRQALLREGMVQPEPAAWAPVSEGKFEPPDAGDRRLWADVERIAPRSRPRVVLLGESAARGYLYDPALTPAQVLESALPGVEVLDLARTDLGPDLLLRLFAGLPQLQPDAVVVFAGNNWNGVNLGLPDLGVADVLRRGGYAALRHVILEQLLAPRCAAILDAIAALAREHVLPLVWVVPEFNLGDWRAEAAAVPPVLPGGGNPQWAAVRDEALRARAEGRLDDAAALGDRLLELDGGTSPVGHELIADAALVAGRVDEARARLEAARDAVCGLLAGHAPRCPGVVQEVMRAKAAEHGFGLVDLPLVYSSLLGGALPDRRVFLDYCHLTKEGIAAAMSAAARVLSPVLGIDPVEPALAISEEDEATAHLLAAVHNAHHGQRREIVAHHLARAGGDQLRLLAEVAVGDGPPWTSPSFAELCGSRLASRYLVSPDPRLIARLADHELIVDGWPVRKPADLLATEHSAPTFWDWKGRAQGPERAYYRAPETRSRFFLPWDGGKARLRLTVRGPAGNARIGGTTVPLTPEWSAHHFELELRPGVNELVVEWPGAAKGDLEADARRIERGISPDVYPTYGEIHSFVAG